MSSDGPPEEQPTNPTPPEQPVTQPDYPPPPGYAAPPPTTPPTQPPGPEGPPANIPPMAPPPPGPQPAPGGPRQFIIGLALGAIPLILALVGLGSIFSPANTTLSSFLTAGGAFYVIGLILSIILIIVTPTRRVGLGMLTALLASPVIFFIGCLVALTHPVA